MRTLLIDCATEACSVALYREAHPDIPLYLLLIAGESRILGRGHAEHLVSMIAALPEKGRADRIVVTLGPGSFTGVRIGLAAARALGLAWKAEVLGYPTLKLVMDRTWQSKLRPVTVCMTGGHGQWFVQNFGEDGWPEDEVQSLTPEQAKIACRHRVIAGSKAEELAEVLGDGRLALDLLPDATKIAVLVPDLLRTDLTPIYGRAPDARLPA